MPELEVWGNPESADLPVAGTLSMYDGALVAPPSAFGEGASGAMRFAYAGLQGGTGSPYQLARHRLYDPELGRFASADPIGLASEEASGQSGARPNAGLAEAGYTDARALMQGSAVTGRSVPTGAAFDAARVSDFDIALGSPSLLARARELGAELPSASTRTGPASPAQVQQLGLGPLQESPSHLAGRPVNFMIYEDAAAAAARDPSISIPCAVAST